MPRKARTKHNIKAIFCALVCVLLCFSACGCFPDLGEIENETDYKAKFSSVEFVKSDLYHAEKSITDLYNSKAVDFSAEDFVCPTESNRYKYMAVFAGEDVEVSEFALYLCSETDVVMHINVYSADGLPGIIALGTDDDKETYIDPDTGDEKTRLKTFDEPNSTDALASVTVSLKANEWNSFSITKWLVNTQNLGSVSIEKGKCLLFQFANNCIVYDSEGIAKSEYPSASVCFTAMMIRVK